MIVVLPLTGALEPFNKIQSVLGLAVYVGGAVPVDPSVRVRAGGAELVVERTQNVKTSGLAVIVLAGAMVSVKLWGDDEPVLSAAVT